MAKRQRKKLFELDPEMAEMDLPKPKKAAKKRPVMKAPRVRVKKR